MGDAAEWVDHLRRGGTDPWEGWRDGRSTTTPDVVPGAQQLEVLRRLNLRGAVDAALVERVLAASAPGRGTPDLELVGNSVAEFGPAPVDPAAIPPGELSRVVAGLVAEDLTSSSGTGGSDPTASRRRWWRRPKPYRLVGDPWLASRTRAALSASGHPPVGGSGRRPKVVFVLAPSVGQMLVGLWSARAFGFGVKPWQAWLGEALSGDRLPRRADPATLASGWADRVGQDRVVVVSDPADLPFAFDRPAPLSASAVEIARLVGAPLGLLVTADERRRILRSDLLPRVKRLEGPLLLPDDARTEAFQQTVTRRLERRGYRVPVENPSAPTVTSPAAEDVLDGLLGLLAGDRR